MRATALLLTTAAMCVFLLGCHPTTGPADETSNPVAVESGPSDVELLAEVGLRYYWSLPLKLNGSDRISRLYQVDENVYALTEMNMLIGISARTGVPMWRHEVTTPGLTVFDPVHADEVPLPKEVVGIEGVLDPSKAVDALPIDLVMINTITDLTVLNRRTGELMRSKTDVPFKFAANSAGTTDGKSFFVGAASGEVVAMRFAEAIRGWYVTTDEMISAPPTYYNDQVYVASREMGAYKFFAIQFNPDTRVQWSQIIGGQVVAPFYVGPRGCYVACDDMRIYAFDPDSGEKLWEQPFTCRGPARQGIQISEQTAFQYAENDRLYAIHLFTGEKRWDMVDGRSVLAVMDQNVYVLDKDRNLVVVDEMTGEVTTTIDMSNFDLFVPNTTTPAIFVGQRGGEMRCIRRISDGHLTIEDLRTGPPSR
jgi:outer membrane protein assembly factor BamB